MPMRLSARRCIGLGLVVASIVVITICFQGLKSRASVSRFEFLEHALHTGTGFRENHDDSTGGWLTRWFVTDSRSEFLSNRRHKTTKPSRCSVYTYFDTSKHHHGSDEAAVLLAWKRAFYALGFNPVVFTDKDAKKHAQYSVLRNRNLVGGSGKADLSKWLVMAKSGGLFVDYRNIPMPAYDNLHFASFQTCDFGHLTAYKSTGEQVIHGTAQEYTRLIQQIVQDPSTLSTTPQALQILETMPSMFNVEPSLEGFATYSEAAIGKLFPNLKPSQLPSLINVHLHEHFLRTHPVLALVDPVRDPQLTLFSQRMTSIAEPIAACPSSPFTSTCPPGFPRCKPCNPASISRFRSLANLPPDAFVLATVPHPLTFLTYTYRKPTVEARFLRESRRDEWMTALTADMMDKRSGGYQRLQLLEEFIDSPSIFRADAKVNRGIWQIWEEPETEGLQSTLGFLVDMKTSGGDEGARDVEDSTVLSAKERVLLQGPESSRDVVESWNLAWTELWYFIRALRVRRKAELRVIEGLSF